MTSIEEQLRREMREAAMQTAESPDLFARIEHSLVADRTRWAVRARVVWRSVDSSRSWLPLS